MRILLCMIAVLGFSGTVFGEGVTLAVNSSRLVRIIDTITFKVIENEANKIVALATKSKKPIYLLLNSPGGSVLGGSSVIDAVHLAQSRDIEVICFSGSLAASMAFNIFAHCNKRYAFENTKLLFHPMSLSVRGAKVGHLETTVGIMATNERKTMNFLQKTLNMDKALFLKHYRAETLWETHDLLAVAPGFLTIVRNVTGIKNIFTYTKPNGGFFSKSRKRGYPLIPAIIRKNFK